MPLSFIMASPPGVVGAFAPSTTIFAWIPKADFSVIASERAAGIRTSTFKCRSSSFVSFSLPGTLMFPCSLKWFHNSSIDLNPVTPPCTSLTAMTFMPMCSQAIAPQYPTFPKPWMATVAPCGSIPLTRSASRAAIATPSPVADVRPSEPPRTIGLPVTTPGTENPALTE